MTRTLALCGWGQPHHALSNVLPHATALDYAHHSSVQAALAQIAQAAPEHRVAVGWSLGGQLLVRALAAGLVKFDALVLIAVPYQFVQTPHAPVGMKRDLFDKFRDNYAKNPLRTLHKAWELIALGDSQAEQVRGHMSSHSKDAMLEKQWLHWLDMLDGFSCATLNYDGFPPTLLIHGEQDAVVSHEQQQCFARHIPSARIVSLPGAGHAPHWHNEVEIRTLVDEFAVQHAGAAYV
jgi:pimeloyl-[acyl-carrier protein] methyl ester esterase